MGRGGADDNDEDLGVGCVERQILNLFPETTDNLIMPPRMVGRLLDRIVQ